MKQHSIELSNYLTMFCLFNYKELHIITTKSFISYVYTNAHICLYENVIFVYICICIFAFCICCFLYGFVCLFFIFCFLWKTSILPVPGWPRPCVRLLGVNWKSILLNLIFDAMYYRCFLKL